MPAKYCSRKSSKAATAVGSMLNRFTISSCNPNTSPIVNEIVPIAMIRISHDLGFNFYTTSVPEFTFSQN